MQKRYIGEVKFFDKTKGWGFIFCDEFRKDVKKNIDVFFGLSDLPENTLPIPYPNIEFGVFLAKRGWKAVNIVFLPPDSLVIPDRTKKETQSYIDQEEF